MVVRILLGLFMALTALFDSAAADEAAAWDALRAGGHVALMRHTDAPGGTGDPPGFTLGDCATQRNLSARGRAEAAAIGARIKAERVAFETILSSPWCRCVDTAELMKLGPVETKDTFSNVVVLSEQRDALTQGAQSVIASWNSRGALLIVTHGANIRALTGISPTTGEIVVVKAGADGSIEPIGRIPPPR
jgi:phosphohistidine phosphatase SixA